MNQCLFAIPLGFIWSNNMTMIDAILVMLPPSKMVSKVPVNASLGVFPMWITGRARFLSK
jgi:hypothetical protein